jgi:nucleotide-binding universal stress UspA family protein
MIKSILVPATGGEADDAVFTSALTVARAFAAYLDFLHVRIDATAATVAMATDTGGGALLGGLIDRIEAEADEQEGRAKERFRRFCEREKLALPDGTAAPSAPVAAWHREIGPEPDWVAEYGRAADLVVIGRPREGEGVARDTLEAALIETGRPLLLPGAAALAALPETVAIAWKPTREAAHAVAAAMPFLHRAKSTVILTVAETAGAPGDGAERVADGLRRHGLLVSLRRLDQNPEGTADTLLTAAREAGALLAMGGYGHSRLREWIFGGVTERVLSGAEVPVLIAH